MGAKKVSAVDATPLQRAGVARRASDPSRLRELAKDPEPRVRSAVIGNAKQFFLMRQSDRGDLADIARDLPLPETALDAIQRYPMPEQLPADRRHSSLCYFTPTAQPPQCGTLRHFQEEPCAPAA